MKDLLSSVFGRAVKWGLLDTNPAKGIEDNTEISRDRFLKPGELPRLFAALAAEPNITFRDLRRTMGSWQARTGASMIVIGKSLGHKSQPATAVYARLDLDPVRQSMEAATSAMLQAAGLKQPAEVTPITEGNAKRKQG